MKKILFLFTLIFSLGILNITTSYASSLPTCDETYNNNQGAIYANGTPIIISEENGKTLVSWENGSQIVPNSVTIFGGGNGGNFTSSSIAMNGGTVKNAHVKLNSGSIEKFYVGGETEDSTVTGVIDTVNTNLVVGNIGSLNAGTSNSSVISINNDNFKVVSTDDVKITNDTIEDSKIKIDYDFDVSDENLVLFTNKSKKLDLNIKTVPENYESVFNDVISYNCQNSDIACISNDGVVTGISKGNTIIEVKVGNKIKTVNVEVKDSHLLIFIGIAILMLYVIILFLIFGVYVPIW